MWPALLLVQLWESRRKHELFLFAFLTARVMALFQM
jgi:hypothetical protein